LAGAGGRRARDLGRGQLADGRRAPRPGMELRPAPGALPSRSCSTACTRRVPGAISAETRA
jgi:hypothetical protein